MFASKRELSSALRRSFYLSVVIGSLAGTAWLFGWLILAFVAEMNGYIQIPKHEGDKGSPFFGFLALLLVISALGVTFWVTHRVRHRWGVACPYCDYRPMSAAAMQQLSRTGRCMKCSCDLLADAQGDDDHDDRAHRHQ